MTRTLKLACLGATLCTAAAWAQAPSERVASTAKTTAAATSTSPVAYVYVASYISQTSTTELNAYAAASNGSLTRVEGSPFQDAVTGMAVNGKYLFGVDGTDINAYFIESNGSLEYAASTNYTNVNDACGYGGPLFFDHSGASLYNYDYDGSECANNTYQAFSVVKSNGDLTYLNEAGGNENLQGPLSFIGNDDFAYTSDCYHSGPGISAFKRNSNGSLTLLNISPALPTAPEGEGYCPYLAAADPTNHVAIPVQLYGGYGDPIANYQLATYTADSSGNLTTTSTSANMPTSAIANLNYVNMAPSGKLLAVAGSNGLQIFHFNGASPVTAYTGLLTSDQINQMFWDNENHLYAISETSGKLFVFTITPTSYSQAPGSPYTVASPENIIVQPWPRY